MRKMMELTTKRLMLLDFKDNDFDFYQQLEQDFDTLQFESDVKPTDQEVKNQFLKLLELKQSKKRKKYSFIIKDKENHQSIGRIVLWETDASISEWEMGWYVHIAFKNNGYATEAAQEMLKFAFKHLNAHRVQALCHHLNEASIQVMNKIGMKKEGELRAIRRLNQQWINMVIYSILDQDICY
jgi:[ribosomal protein S5]-alanine N-acetyltransferase